VTATEQAIQEKLLTTLHHTRIDASNEIKVRVVPLVERHLAHLQPANDQTVRRLANLIKGFMRVYMEFDMFHII
jgi:hypothetical protein